TLTFALPLPARGWADGIVAAGPALADAEGTGAGAAVGCGLSGVVTGSGAVEAVGVGTFVAAGVGATETMGAAGTGAACSPGLRSSLRASAVRMPAPALRAIHVT